MFVYVGKERPLKGKTKDFIDWLNLITLSLLQTLVGTAVLQDNPKLMRNSFAS